MTLLRPVIFASASLAALSIATVAQAAQPAQDPADAQAAEASEAGGGEIVVTARRRAEALKDVPQTVSVATGEQLKNLNIEQMGDIDRVVTGLQINGLSVSMRGLTFDVNAASNATVANFLNEAPVISTIMFRSLFDVGQIEVLRGPQGTLRGVASPSGSMTLTTRKPVLTEWGGQASLNLNNRHEWNGEAAVNIPVIKDVLGIRAAGVVDHDSKGVRSLNNPIRPSLESVATRLTILFKPTDTISTTLMWQHLSMKGKDFGSALFGNGAVGGVNPNAPPGYNGPVLTPENNRTVSATPSVTNNNIDLITGQLDWTVGGQKLSYIGSFQDLKTPLLSAADPTNMLLGFPLLGSDFPGNAIRFWTHEARLSSVERVAGIFDYVTGFYHAKRDDTVDGLNGVASLLGGAFGPPGTVANPNTDPNLRYSVNVHINFPVHTTENSFFGNVTAHITPQLEISGGLRKIFFNLDRTATIQSTAGFNAIALALPCSVIPASATNGPGIVSPTYGVGFCEVPVLQATQVFLPQKIRERPWLWDAAISYHITPDLMVYGHAGTSWRQPFAGVGIANGTNNAKLNELLLGKSERSKSFEAGVKWSFLEGRGHLFVDYFHQSFDGLIYGVPGGARYLASPTSVRSNPFFVNVPAKINGMDIELGLRLTDRWNINGNFSWSKGRISGEIPCTDGDFNGVPDGINATPQQFVDKGVAIAICQSNAGTSTAPNWNMRVNSEYNFPISEDAEGFVRGLFGYQPKNKNASLTFTAPSYGLLDLFMGIRLPQRGLELSVYARNITNTDKILNQSAGFIAAPAGLQATFGQTGYRSVSFTPRREFGVNLRFAFGSR